MMPSGTVQVGEDDIEVFGLPGGGGGVHGFTLNPCRRNTYIHVVYIYTHQ